MVTKFETKDLKPESTSMSWLCETMIGDDPHDRCGRGAGHVVTVDLRRYYICDACLAMPKVRFE